MKARISNGHVRTEDRTHQSVSVLKWQRCRSLDSMAGNAQDELRSRWDQAKLRRRNIDTNDDYSR
jgi:hypothetical protein